MKNTELQHKYKSRYITTLNSLFLFIICNKKNSQRSHGEPLKQIPSPTAPQREWKITARHGAYHFHNIKGCSARPWHKRELDMNGPKFVVKWSTDSKKKKKITPRKWLFLCSCPLTPCVCGIMPQHIKTPLDPPPAWSNGVTSQNKRIRWLHTRNFKQ